MTLQDPDAPVELLRVPSEGEAEVVAGALRAANIPAQVSGGTTAGLRFEFVGQASVLVARRNVDAARQVLKELHDGPPVQDADVPIIDNRPSACPACEYDLAGLEEVCVCPECGLRFDASPMCCGVPSKPARVASPDEHFMPPTGVPGRLTRSFIGRVVFLLGALAIIVALVFAGRAVFGGPG